MGSKLTSQLRRHRSPALASNNSSSFDSESVLPPPPNTPSLNRPTLLNPFDPDSVLLPSTNTPSSNNPFDVDSPPQRQQGPPQPMPRSQRPPAVSNLPPPTYAEAQLSAPGVNLLDCSVEQLVLLIEKEANTQRRAQQRQQELEWLVARRRRFRGRYDN